MEGVEPSIDEEDVVLLWARRYGGDLGEKGN